MASKKLIDKTQAPKKQITVKELHEACAEIIKEGGENSTLLIEAAGFGFNSVNATNVVFDNDRKHVHIY